MMVVMFLENFRPSKNFFFCTFVGFLLHIKLECMYMETPTKNCIFPVAVANKVLKRKQQENRKHIDDGKRLVRGDDFANG